MAMTKEQGKAINEELSQSTISNEMATVLLIADAMDMMLRDVDRRIRAVYAGHGVNVSGTSGKDNILTGMARYCRAARNASYWYFRDVEPRVSDGTFGSYGAQSYDNFNVAASELARAMMMIVDRGQRDEQMGRIFDFIAGLESSGRFTHEDIERLIVK